MRVNFPFSFSRSIPFSIRAIGILVLCQFGFFSQAQYFTNVTNALGINVTTTHNNWGCGVSFYDFNKDGWPDLSFSKFNQPPVFYINNQGTFEIIELGIPNNHEAKMIEWVDYDNDGDMDLFMTRYMGPWSLYQNDGNLVMTDVTDQVGITQIPAAMAFGASWGDINNDGWLDLYISNYNTNVNQPGTTVTNYLFRSNGDGTFTEVAAALGVSNGSKHSFLTTFVDINRDGWQDLYVANDRLPDSNDLYLNIGAGQFANITNGSGADVYLNTMSNTVGDFDNDGDLDFYIANSEAGNNLLRNNGNNTFTNVAVASGVAVNQFCWGNLWLDYNLDGWQDLYVNTGTLSNNPGQNYFYTGDGDGTFTYAFLSGFQGHLNVAHSCATGDYDNDGNPDILVGVRAPLKCELWHNNLVTSNNYLKVSLEGVISNKDGIGSFIDCYTGGNLQTRYTMCGEGFMSQNAQYKIFGLGENVVVDSLKITWLSGIVDVFYDVEPNQWLHILEGSSFSAHLNYSGTQTICETDSITLFAGEYQSYMWNNGETTPSITVNQPGTYSVAVTHPNGLVLETNEVTVEVQLVPDLMLSSSEFICNGSASGYINSATHEFHSIDWYVNEQSIQMPLEGLTAGTYTVTGISGFCSATQVVSIQNTEDISAEFEWSNPTCFGGQDGSIQLLGTTGGIGPIQMNPEVSQLNNLPEGSYSVLLTDSLGCQQQYDFELIAPLAIEGETVTTNADENNENGAIVISVQGGTPPYSITWSNGQTGESIENLQNGSYTATVTDANGCEMSFDATVNVGIDEISNFCIPYFSQNSVYFPCSDAVKIEVRSIDGRLVRTISGSGSHFRLPELSSGMYILNVQHQNGIYTTLKITL